MTSKRLKEDNLKIFSNLKTTERLVHVTFLNLEIGKSPGFKAAG